MGSVYDEVDKDTSLAKQEKISEYCLEDIEEKSDSTDDDGDDDTNDEDDEGTPKKETRAPLELMAEVSFLVWGFCRVSFCSSGASPGTHAIDQAGLELMEICLSLPPEC